MDPTASLILGARHNQQAAMGAPENVGVTHLMETGKIFEKKFQNAWLDKKAVYLCARFRKTTKCNLGKKLPKKKRQDFF